MVEATAESKEQEKAKSPEEIKKDEEAAKLLKELEEEEKEEAAPESKTDEEGEAAKKKKEEEEAAAAKAKADESESQSEKTATPKKKGFERRVSRLVKQREEAKGEKDEIAQRLHTSEEEKKLLRMRLEQLQNAKEQEIKEPDADQFDGGELDPEFLKKQKEFNQAEFRKIAREEAANIAKQGSQTAAQEKQASDLKRKQQEHWKNADELGATDYDEAEVKAIDILGVDMVNNIIDFFPDESHKVMFYLGLDANADEAEALSEMFSSGQRGLVSGVAEVGRILERIKDNPLKTSITPDPDEETEGSAPSPREALQLKLDKLREDTAKTGRSDGMKKILAFKKKARDRGITLR